MSTTVWVRNCVLPLDLYYRVEEHLWLRPETDGTITLGFTDVAQTTAGGMLVVSFRPVGPLYARGKVVSVVESGKWLGPLRAPMDAVLEAANDDLLQDAALINRSPYQRGWVVRMKPLDLQAGLEGFVTGEAAAQAYEAYMGRRELDGCIHCEGYEMSEAAP
ncbi:MAG: glycine cleavage system protein H [Bacteroidota bacterium]